ncbi:MAG: hypothetical protein V1859_01270 [archaeon]
MNFGKRGVFFTFAAIFLVILIISVSTTKTTFRYQQKGYAITSRVRAMNTFLTDMENDLDRELYIGGYRALLGMQKYIRIKEGFIENPIIIFSEIFINGTANGTTIDLMYQEGRGADLTSWVSRINEEANKLNIDLIIIPNNISLEMISPWITRISASFTINVTDENKIASFEYNKTFYKEISIIGFEDPLYTVYTDDKVSNLIFATTVSDFVDDATNSTEGLMLHLNMSYYNATGFGPDFLMRFSGNLSASAYGIESMINLEDLQKQGISVKNQSVVDYIYFGTTSPPNYCNVQNMPSWFIIDIADASGYEVNKLEKETC